MTRAYVRRKPYVYHGPRNTDPRQFWLRAEKRGQCWEFESGGGHRYGRVRWNGASVYAHRLVWEWMNGPIPDGLCVCHHCDNPRCVRPDHLFLGTVRDNNLDRIAKGRRGVGVYVEVAA